MRVNYYDFRAKDVLIWCDRDGNVNDNSGRHIAVIDNIQASSTDGLRALVVEFTGTLGLVDSVYTFVETSEEGVYRVIRPLKPGRRECVRVVPVL